MTKIGLENAHLEDWGEFGMTIFLYNTAQRDQMLPRKPLPNPESEEKSRLPLEDIFPGAPEKK